MPAPPTDTDLPLVHAAEDIARWLQIYWQKLRIPASQARCLAVTDDRQEFARWTGRRLNSFALGCYCYLPLPSSSQPGAAHIDYDGSHAATRSAPSSLRQPIQLYSPSLWDDPATPPERLITPTGLASDFRHLIFIEPTLLPASAEVTVAHELIHLRDRVQGQPRRHRCHGNDAIALDEALITGRDPEVLRTQLREETDRREAALRAARPYRYLYRCPHCGKDYYRVRRYTRPTSCGKCDSRFNPTFELRLETRLQLSAGADVHP
jgi:predicted SprT family Zn-dependent metalloprotease